MTFFFTLWLFAFLSKKIIFCKNKKNPFSNEERIYGNIQKQSQKIKYFDSLLGLMNVQNRNEWFYAIIELGIIC